MGGTSDNNALLLCDMFSVVRMCTLGSRRRDCEGSGQWVWIYNAF